MNISLGNNNSDILENETLTTEAKHSLIQSIQLYII